MAERKTRYDKVLSKLPDTLQWRARQDISATKTFLLENDGLPRVFLGSGGSLSAAHLAAQLSVECGIVAVAMTPYQYIFVTSPAAESIYNNKTISDSILELPIENIARVSSHIVRGETLWASRNRKHLDSVKEAGVDCIIDFRTADFTEKFSEVCASKGIEYRHFPIDKANLPDEELLKSLPELFDMLDNRNCYISCQQGMHRTNIALAIYYMFHDIPFIPDLRGHKKNGNLRCDDIMRRINSLYATLTPELKDLLGIPNYGYDDFRLRRKKLLDSNR